MCACAHICVNIYMYLLYKKMCLHVHIRKKFPKMVKIQGFFKIHLKRFHKGKKLNKIKIKIY